MVNAFVTLCFLLVAAGATTVIWAMIADNRAAILSALGLTNGLVEGGFAQRRVTAASGRRRVVTVRLPEQTARRAA